MKEDSLKKQIPNKMLNVTGGKKMRSGKLKKVIALFLAVAMSITLFSGCSTPAKVEAPAGKKKLNVVLILNGNLGDKSFADLANAGLQRAKTELGVNVKIVELGGDATKQEPVITEFAESKDWDLLVIGTYNLKETAQKVAVQYPDKKFILYDAKADFDKMKLPNMYSVEHKQNEASFLAGAMAAKLTQSGVQGTNPKKVIGFVGGGENASINDFLVGYIEGAEYADKDSKVYISYVGDFKNAAKAKEMALAQYQQGADIIFQVASAAGLGVLSAAKEAKSFSIGVDADQAELFRTSDPETASRIATSVIKKVDNTVFNAIKGAVDGTLPWGKYEAVGIKTGSMALAKNDFYEKSVPADIRAFVEETEKKIKSGEIVVSTAIGMPTEKITEIKNRVKP